MNKTQKALITEQEEILRRSEIIINDIRKLLDAVENCIIISKGFPIYLTDLTDKVNLLEILGHKYIALKSIK